MSGIIRNIDVCSGHDCFPPRLPITWATTVKIENCPVERFGDILEIHCCPDGSCHAGIYIGTNEVKIDGRAIQKEGDPITCGSTCMSRAGMSTVG